ncbi:response regulator [Chloroflexota bacterium]
MNEKKRKILVVDDEEQALRLMEAMLVPNGYDVILLGDSNKVAEVAQSQKPDLIILDVMMPELDGYTALTEIKEDEGIKHIPVIMATAVGYEMNKQLAETLGAADYLTKPIELTNLLETISRFLPRS